MSCENELIRELAQSSLIENTTLVEKIYDFDHGFYFFFQNFKQVKRLKILYSAALCFFSSPVPATTSRTSPLHLIFYTT